MSRATGSFIIVSVHSARRVNYFSLDFSFLILLFSDCRRHFSIVAPENIRPNSDYHVSVSLHDSPTPCDFRIGIEGVDNYRNTREIHVEPYTSQLVQIDTGYMAPGNYKLIAEGLRGIEGFRDDAYLTFLPKNTSILLQSDKAIYKPGDLVRFRVLVLDMNMKPHFSTGPIRIFITVRANLSVSKFAKK